MIFRVSLRFLAVFAGLSIAASQSSAEEFDCILHQNAMGAPVIHLTSAHVDSIGDMLSNQNVEIIERIDAAYREGKYGKPGSDEAKEAALSAFAYHSRTAFDFVTTLALQDQAIYLTTDADLEEAFRSKFRNPGFYPVVDLESGMTGFGRYCLTFRVDGKPKEIVVGGETMKGWPENVEIDGKKTRVLNINMRTLSYDRVHVVYERHSQGAITAFEDTAGGHPLYVTAMEEITGNYVDKWGFHKVNAMAMWKTIVPELDPPPAQGAHLGAAIYFPKLELSMPLLPDPGFDDLRKYDYAEAFLTMDSTREIQAKKLDWLRIKKNLRFKDWEGDGGIPPVLKERYPDK
jgi:hypothetical protein